MGQNSENREGDDPGLIVAPGRGELRSFQGEIRAAVRYERGLFFKALMALGTVAVIVAIGTLYFR